MKRPIAIIVVLLILAAIIGFERIGSRLQFLISDDRTASEAQFDESTNHEELESRGAPREEHERRESLAGASNSSEPRQGNTDVGRVNGSGGGPAVEVRITGEVSPLHFIRASTIVGTSEPSEEQVNRLRESVAVAAAGLDPSAIIFDADALAFSQAAVLQYARDDFDLTTQVKAIYDALENESLPLAETANVEQDGAGQAPTRPEPR